MPLPRTVVNFAVDRKCDRDGAGRERKRESHKRATGIPLPASFVNVRCARARKSSPSMVCTKLANTNLFTFIQPRFSARLSIPRHALRPLLIPCSFSRRVRGIDCPASFQPEFRYENLACYFSRDLPDDLCHPVLV